MIHFTVFKCQCIHNMYTHTCMCVYTLVCCMQRHVPWIEYCSNIFQVPQTHCLVTRRFTLHDTPLVHYKYCDMFYHHVKCWSPHYIIQHTKDHIHSVETASPVLDCRYQWQLVPVKQAVWLQRYTVLIWTYCFVLGHAKVCRATSFSFNLHLNRFIGKREYLQWNAALPLKQN